MSVLLRKLTLAAMLSPDEASEEFRHAAVKSLKRLIAGLRPCRRSFCGCKSSALPYPIIFGKGCLKADLVSALSTPPKNTAREAVEETAHENEECLIEFLQSENMSVAVGHLLSLFLQISETEASKGGTGSAKLRIDALSTLRILLFKVGTADALAFFLPGIASRLVNSVQSSKRMNAGLSELSYPSGAAGSSGAIEQAVRALAELLVLVLADERNLTALERRPLSAKSSAEPSSWEGHHLVAEAALETLRKVSNELKETKEKQAVHVNFSGSDAQDTAEGASGSNSLSSIVPKSGNPEAVDSFRVERNNAWLKHTVERISILLSLSFSALCRHPTPSVRLAVTEGTMMVMLTCRLTLEGSMSTLLECLLAMACDEWPYVASTAHAALMFLMTQESVGVLRDVKGDLKQVIYRLIERLPKAIFSGDESVTVFLFRQLLAAMFFAGPDGVSDCIFQSPAATTQFVTVMVQCFSFNSAFAGPLKQLSLVNRSSLGYIPGILELSIDKVAQTKEEKVLTEDLPHRLSLIGDGKPPSKDVTAGTLETQELPRMPPWFRQTVGRKFYRELAGILRLAGLSSMLVSGDTRHISVLIEELLAPLRRAPFDIQAEVYRGQVLVGGGQWQRTAATATSVLNEVFYGASGLWIHGSPLLFGGLHCSKERTISKMQYQEVAGITQDLKEDLHPSVWDPWEDFAQGLSCKILKECVGDVLHEFMSDAIWKLPLHSALDMSEANGTISQLHVHILEDNSSLQQVILEGIGVLGLSVGKLFEEQGFLGSVLYLLLERLGCTDYPVSSTADLALRVVSSACGYPSVRALIVASTDYIIDSLCRQLRHIDLYPNAPNMLAAVLRYTGAAQDLVPLLQEPMRCISLELEIPARQGYPVNTLPMLRALKEIVKAARSEGSCMLEKAILTSHAPHEKIDHTKNGEQCDDTVSMDILDEIISNLKESERCRQSVQDIVILCLNSCSPLMASNDQHKCLLALEIVEVGMVALASMDAVMKHEKEERERARNLVGHDDVSADFNETESPKLLPTMHRVWPHLAACLKHTTPSVLVQSVRVIASVVSSCGGEFFTRRFQKDTVPKFLNLLCQGTALQPNSEGGQKRLLPHFQGNYLSVHKEFAPASLLRVQEAVLTCITDIAKNKKSAPALTGSLEQLAAVVVGLACGITALQDCATQALIALSNIESDLLWILVADIAYGSGNLQSREVGSPGSVFPKVSKLLPPFLSTHQEALWIQLSGKDLDLNIDSSKAWTILSRMETCK